MFIKIRSNVIAVAWANNVNNEFINDNDNSFSRTPLAYIQYSSKYLNNRKMLFDIVTRFEYRSCKRVNLHAFEVLGTLRYIEELIMDNDDCNFLDIQNICQIINQWIRLQAKYNLVDALQKNFEYFSIIENENNHKNLKVCTTFQIEKFIMENPDIF